MVPAPFPRPDLYFLAYEDGEACPLSDAQVVELLTGESVHHGHDHLRVGEVQCTWIDSGAPGSKTLGFRGQRWARLRLNDGRVTSDLVCRSHGALSGPHPILDSFGPHEPWEPTPREWDVIKLEAARRGDDLLWLIMAMGLGFEFDGHPQELRARAFDRPRLCGGRET